MHVSDEELYKRKQQWQPLAPLAEGGYVSMYIKHVELASEGADLDFLKGNSGSEVTRDAH